MGSSLSVCTICQDEEYVIRWYLESMAHIAATLPDLKEVVLVDGGSKDNTIDIINSYKDRIPIRLFERTWDFTRAQMNYGIDQCSGDYIFVPDADMTVTTNFSAWFKSGEHKTSSYWDFMLLFTARDAYHYFNWPVGPSMRLFKAGKRYDETRKYHVHLEGQYSGIPVCKEVIMFENSMRVSNEAALLHRGERRQICRDDMTKEGGDPGPPDRFLNAQRASLNNPALVLEIHQSIKDIILPSTNG